MTLWLTFAFTIAPWTSLDGDLNDLPGKKYYELPKNCLVRQVR